jgi:hypothetical protein
MYRGKAKTNRGLFTDAEGHGGQDQMGAATGRAGSDGERAPSVFLVAQLSHRLHVSTDYIILGTMRGVDGEIAARLLEAHPELHSHNRTGSPDANGGNGNSPRPRKRGTAS